MSKRYYVTLTLVMILLLFLFQVSALGSSYFYKEKNQIGKEKNRIVFSDAQIEHKSLTEEFTILVEQIGGQNLAVTEALSMLKYPYEIVNSLQEALNRAEEKSVKRIVIGYEDLVYPDDFLAIKRAVEKKIALIFTVLPKEDFLKIQEVKKLFGIASIKQDKIKTKGIRVMESFLIGNRMDYPDILVEKIPYILADGSSKVYMSGLLEEEENKRLPVLAWRTYQEGIPLFFFNVPFLRKKEYTGMFFGALAVMEKEFVYPVINARAFLVNGFPSLSEENEDEIKRLYSKGQRRLLEDTILPDLTAITRKTRDKISGLAVLTIRGVEIPQQEKTDTMSFFIDEMAARQGEIGLGGGDGKSSLSSAKNLDVFLKRYPDFRFSFLDGRRLAKEEWKKIVEKMPEIGTIITDFTKENIPDISFLENDVVSTVVTSKGFAYSDIENLKLKCAISGFGLSNHMIDLEETLYPKTEEDSWRVQNIELSKNLDTFWKPYQAFDTLTLSQEGDRIRQYLLLQYEVKRKEDTIQILVQNKKEDAYFILRTYKEIVEMTGGTYKQIDGENYLLTIKEDQVVIKVKDRR